jgi:hypothetical protein
LQLRFFFWHARARILGVYEKASWRKTAQNIREKPIEMATG